MRKLVFFGMLLFHFSLTGESLAGPTLSSEEACVHLVKVANSQRFAGSQSTGEYKCYVESVKSKFFVLALRYSGMEVKEGTSNLVAYYALEKSNSTVYEWNFANEKRERQVWPLRTKDKPFLKKRTD